MNITKVANFFDIKKAYGIVFLYSLLVLINRLKAGVIWVPDTRQYIDNSIIRPPVYPLTMDVFKLIFGSHEFFALIFSQLIFVLIAAFYLSNLLRKKFEIHPITFIMLHLFLSLPLLSISVAAGIHGEIGNKLLTEAFSYGLFLLTVSFLVKTLFSDERRNLIIFILLTGLLTLIRTQMIFMYVIAIVSIIVLQLKTCNIRSIIILVVTGIAVFAFAELTERFYHQSVNHYFGKVSLNASHILVGAIYVTDEKIINNIVNQQDREVLKRTYDYMENKKLLAKNRFEINRRLIDLYNDHFAAILNNGLMASFQHVYPQHMHSDEMLLKFESFSRRVVPVLICHNYKELGKLMLLKFLYTLNFREGFFIALFLLFPFIRLSHEFMIFTFFVFLMLIINRLIMTPVIYIGDRYLFYTDILEYVIFIILAEQYLKNNVFQAGASPEYAL
jgi:hypothetical protein